MKVVDHLAMRIRGNVRIHYTQLIVIAALATVDDVYDRLIVIGAAGWIFMRPTLSGCLSEESCRC